MIYNVKVFSFVSSSATEIKPILDKNIDSFVFSISPRVPSLFDSFTKPSGGIKKGTWKVTA